MKSTVSCKGQITVPVEVRRELGLSTGTPVVFEVREGGVMLRKGAAEHPIDRAYGLLAGERPPDALAVTDEMRGPRPGGPRAIRRRPRRR